MPAANLKFEFIVLAIGEAQKFFSQPILIQGDLKVEIKEWTIIDTHSDCLFGTKERF